MNPETEYDYHSLASERRRRRVIDDLNNKPGISPGLRNVLLIGFGVGVVVLVWMFR